MTTDYNARLKNTEIPVKQKFNLILDMTKGDGGATP